MPQAGNPDQPTHNLLVGYLFWFFGFTGLHRFYYGRPVTGALWLFTGGLFCIGWILDIFFIPGMDAEARRLFAPGWLEYNVAWLLLIFLGIFGLHRFYMGKWGTGILYLLTGGGFLIGIAYDFCTLNRQISEVNLARTRFA